MKLMEEIEAQISSDEEEEEDEKKPGQKIFGPSDGEKAVQLDHIKAMRIKIKKLED